MRAKLKGGAEWDCFSRWRKLLCYMSKPGVTKSIKRGFNKRQRVDGKRDLQSGDVY